MRARNLYIMGILYSAWNPPPHLNTLMRTPTSFSIVWWQRFFIPIDLFRNSRKAESPAADKVSIYARGPRSNYGGVYTDPNSL